MRYLGPTLGLSFLKVCALQGAVSISSAEDKTFKELKVLFPTLATVTGSSSKIHVTKPPDAARSFIESAEKDQVVSPKVSLGGLGPGYWVAGTKAKEFLKTAKGRWARFRIDTDECEVIGVCEGGIRDFVDEPRPIRDFLVHLGENGAARIKMTGHSITRQATAKNGKVSYSTH